MSKKKSTKAPGSNETNQELLDDDGEGGVYIRFTNVIVEEEME